MTVICFLSEIRRCSLVKNLYALGQQPVLTIESLKGEFDFVPSLSFTSYFKANDGMGHVPYKEFFTCFCFILCQRRKRNGEMPRFLNLEMTYCYSKRNIYSRELCFRLPVSLMSASVFKFVHIVIHFHPLSVFILSSIVFQSIVA